MKRSVTRETFFALVIVLLLPPLTAMGQHAGHRTGTTGANTGAQPEDPDVITFEHSIALQARPDQIGQFQEAAKSTEAARTQAHDLQQLADSNSADFARKANRLQDAVEDAQSDNHKFLSSLSDTQVSGLKKFKTAVVKANSAVSKESKALASQIGEGPG